MPLDGKMHRVLSVLVISSFMHVKCESFNLIAGYEPESDVKEHLRLDLDQREFEDFLEQGNFSAASDIYINGGNSRKSAKISFLPLSKTYNKGSKVQQGTAEGILIADAKKGDTSIKVSVTTECYGKFSSNKDASGCFKETGGLLKIDNEDVAAQISIEQPFRTLAGFSIEAESKMSGQKMYEMYKEYYGARDYADKFIKAALKGEDETKRVNVPMDFLGKEEIFRAECAQKGSAYWSVWMYVIREMEDAATDCKSNCPYCNDARVHAWDEAVAFYTGSIEDKHGNEGGKFLYRLAEKRCKNYKTCEGRESKVNKKIRKYFTDGKRLLSQGKCAEIHAIKEKIIDLMSIPLIQGTLRYAYKIAREEDSPKNKAEGIAFLGSIIPRLHHCSHEDAKIVQRHMWFDGDMKTSKDGFKTVKEAFQRNYPCMNVKCADIGGHIDVKTNDYLKDFRPCTDGPNISSVPKMMTSPLVIFLMVILNVQRFR